MTERTAPPDLERLEAALLAAGSRSPRRYADVLYLRFRRGLRQREVAEALGVGRAYAAAAEARALDQLRRPAVRSEALALAPPGSFLGAALFPHGAPSAALAAPSAATDGAPEMRAEDAEGPSRSGRAPGPPGDGRPRRRIPAGLGPRIRAARRERLGVPLDEFGRRVAEATRRGRAFSNVTCSQWERGRQEPNWETLVAIARTTGLPLEYFAGAIALEDCPPPTALVADERLERRPRLLCAAIERQDPATRRLVIRCLEDSLSTLRDDG